MTTLITGSAGFIGYHLAHRLLSEGQRVIGLDSHTKHFDGGLKQVRLNNLENFAGYTHYRADLNDRTTLTALVERFQPQMVYHLAAQAGVRGSLEFPEAYVHSNLTGLFTLLQVLSQHPPRHLIFTSTSSVYGERGLGDPFHEDDPADHPASFYAATKRSGELLTYTYPHLIPTTVARLFTVYGPFGRPDMAPLKFLRLIRGGGTVQIYGDGSATRDFTYIDDVIDSLVALSEVPPSRWQVVNVGGGNPHTVLDLLSALEDVLGFHATITHLPVQEGDVGHTLADPERLRGMIGKVPATPLREGVKELVRWATEPAQPVSRQF